MELVVSVSGKSLSTPISNPFSLDVESLAAQIEAFLLKQGAAPQDLDIRGLLPKMIKGIAGCEGGCPADAKSFVKRGFQNFALAYIEGGILEAKALTAGGADLSLRMFPDF